MSQNDGIEQPIYIESLQHQRDHRYVATNGDAVGRIPVRREEIWNDYSTIPDDLTAAGLVNDGDSAGNVTLRKQKALLPTGGTTHKFQLAVPGDLSFVIPATFGQSAPLPAGSVAPTLAGSVATGYQPVIVDANGSAHPQEPATWVVDGLNNYVQFPYGVPPTMAPPFTLTYVEYTGAFGGGANTDQPLAPTDTPTFAGLSVEDGLSTDLNLGVFAGAPRITSSVVGLPGPLTLSASRVEVPLTTTLNTNVNDPTTLLTKAQVQAEIATAAPQPLAPTDTPSFARLSVTNPTSAIVDLTSSSIAEILATDGGASSIPLSITADPLLVPRTLTANTDVSDPTTLLTKAQVQAEIAAAAPNQNLDTTSSPSFASLSVTGKTFLRDDSIAILESSNLAGTLAVPLEISATELQVPRTLTNNTDVTNSATLLTKAQVQAEIAAAEPQPLAPADNPTFSGVQVIDSPLELCLAAVGGRTLIQSVASPDQVSPGLPQPMEIFASWLGLQCPLSASSLILKAGSLATLSAKNIDGTTPSQLLIDATRLWVPWTTSMNTDVSDPMTLLTKAQVQAEIAAAAPNQNLDTTSSPTFSGVRLTAPLVATGLTALIDSTIVIIEASDGSLPVPMTLSATELQVPRTLTSNTNVTDPTTLLTKAQVQAEIAAAAPNQNLDTTSSPTFSGVRLTAPLVATGLTALIDSTLVTIEATDGSLPVPMTLSATELQVPRTLTSNTNVTDPTTLLTKAQVQAEIVLLSPDQALNTTSSPTFSGVRLTAPLVATGLTALIDSTLVTIEATDGSLPVPMTLSATELQVPRTLTSNTDVSDPTTVLSKTQVQNEIAAAAPNQNLDTTSSPSFASLSVTGKTFLRDDSIAILESSNLAGTLAVPLEISATELQVPRTLTNNTDVTNSATLLTKAQVQAEIATAAPQPLAPTDTPSFARLSVTNPTSARINLTSSNIAEILATDGGASIPLSITADPLIVPRTLTANTDVSDPTTLLSKAQVQAIVAVEPQPLATTETPTFAGATLDGNLLVSGEAFVTDNVSATLYLSTSGGVSFIASGGRGGPVQPMELLASQVSTTAPFTASTVTATSLMVAPNLLGPVLPFGADIKNSSSSDYLVANGRGDGTSLSAVTAWLGHVCPCAGALSVSYSKSSPDVHDFILASLDPVTLTVLNTWLLQMTGIAGSLPTAAVVQAGDLLVLQHDPSGFPATAPGETVVNVYLRPLGNVAPALVQATTEKTAGPQTARQEEWEVV